MANVVAEEEEVFFFCAMRILAIRDRGFRIETESGDENALLRGHTEVGGRGTLIDDDTSKGWAARNTTQISSCGRRSHEDTVCIDEVD